MDVIGFLCVSLGGSTVQLHDSQGSRRPCACSETDFSSQNVDRAFICTTDEQRSVVRFFLWTKGISATDIHKEMFLVCGGRCLSPKRGSQLSRKILSRTFES
jgi:hypothetical protein